MEGSRRRGVRLAADDGHLVLVVRAVIAIGDSLALPFGVDPMALPLARYRHDVAKYRPDAARDGPGF